MVVESPAPKAAPSAPSPSSAEGETVAPTPAAPTPPPAPTSFTIGVTDLTFNTINAIFGRQLKTEEGTIVSLAYWQQKEKVSNDEIPYFEK